MARHDRLQTLRRLAGHVETASARKLGERLRSLSAEERRLGQISQYLGEYERTGIRTDTALTIGSLRGGRGFVERLRAAVTEQRGVVESQRQQADLQASQWKAARAHVLAMEQLADRQAAQERALADRREQARLDEVGQRPPDPRLKG